jgi:ABC-type multidrug transport system fused ATPase/permease subunit
MKIGWSLYVLHNAWCLPTLFVAGIALLYFQVGAAAFGSIGVLLLLFLPNSFVMSKGMGFIKSTFSLRDKRVRLLTEYLQGIRLIKLLAWEDEMAESV